MKTKILTDFQICISVPLKAEYVSRAALEIQVSSAVLEYNE